MVIHVCVCVFSFAKTSKRTFPKSSKLYMCKAAVFMLA